MARLPADGNLVAAAFGEALTLSGVILTKADGDARGGSALSVKTVTGQPIRFLGTGEEMAGEEGDGFFMPKPSVTLFMKAMSRP